MADTVDGDLQAHLVGDALENAVAAFDGFGREASAAHQHLSSQPKKALALSFQTLANADGNLRALFGFGLRDGVTADEWDLLVRCFHKRHLLAHKMGVIDEKYVASAHDPGARVGRKVTIDAAEVSALLSAVGKLGDYLSRSLAGLAQSVSKSSTSSASQTTVQS